ncbi:hypothetical protein CYMTET_39531 [Cymbomonas tetramitiformis]|uniref:Uncharacterized protein n=1 Tax=Cymbomonas tetramitiformis TaxID=36881 RepID=A0AAE0EXF4_9CHLO|nr:hypothetical protein CYMTET_46621 [Cymbomonas tetramitiformis]KAK3251121.1 hypothetical protein CYMTET_39531 [Cymbomonas tetramitiformis]|eukprot:gene24014-29139_t
MSSTWVVPPKPESRGPAGLSSVYFFNGLEDGSGVSQAASLILQPVLQFGKSGCLNDPLLWGEWHFTAYMVLGNGRAYCGKRLAVKPGETLEGGMVAGSSGEWTVTARRVASGQTSSYTANLDMPTGRKIDAAYATLEGMIIYNCKTYPSNNGTTFTNNVIKDGNGNLVNFKRTAWTPVVKHSECGQAVIRTMDGSGDVELVY